MARPRIDPSANRPCWRLNPPSSPNVCASSGILIPRFPSSSAVHVAGWAGGILAMQTFRHKTSKASFQALPFLSPNCCCLLLMGMRRERWRIWPGAEALVHMRAGSLLCGYVGQHGADCFSGSHSTRQTTGGTAPDLPTAFLLFWGIPPSSQQFLPSRRRSKGQCPQAATIYTTTFIIKWTQKEVQIDYIQFLCISTISNKYHTVGFLLGLLWVILGRILLCRDVLGRRARPKICRRPGCSQRTSASS